jgi:hypothetical protein
MRPLLTRSAITTEWCSTSKLPSNCGYSFLMVLKQWGQCVMTLSNAYFLMFSTFSVVTVW